jgi:hypothetical protein
MRRRSSATCPLPTRTVNGRMPVPPVAAAADAAVAVSAAPPSPASIAPPPAARIASRRDN